MAFDQSTRNRLQKFVSTARTLLSEEFTRQMQQTYGMDPLTGEVSQLSRLSHLDDRQRQTAQLLRETLQHYLVSGPTGNTQERTIAALERIVREQSFTVLNRLAALRMAEARGFLLESIAKGYQSEGFKLYQPLTGSSQGETGDSYRCFLFSLFDEFSLDLAILFDRYAKQGQLFPRNTALLSLLDEINHPDIEHLWVEDETIGWIYQYFNSKEERKKMRDESAAPRNSRELAVRNQFFTPRYVVEFLTDNTLGRIWYEMTQGQTGLVESCKYLVRRPTEIFLQQDETAPEQTGDEQASLSQEELLKQPVYIPFRPLKDPREIRMLDPACGSMHFGLYAFDLFERIYEEAWHKESHLGADALVRSQELEPLQTTFASFEDFKAQIPKLIIEHNVHGVDIDPRAVQIAGLSLWQRAQRSWQQQGIKPQDRPRITKSNVVCAEPMPGEKDLLQEFSAGLNPPVLGQLLEVIFDKMQLAGEAGTLLKIEEEIQQAIQDAREQWLQQKGTTVDMFPAELNATQHQQSLFDLSGIDDESFWENAEELILQALSDYAEQAEIDAEQKRLFAEDAAKGFAFIDLCRKRFDVVLMNPPFGEPTDKTLKWLNSVYALAIRNVYIAFIERGKSIIQNNGLIGTITDSTYIHQNRYEKFRNSIVSDANYSLTHLIANGWGVLDAYVETACSVIGKGQSTEIFMVDLRSSEQKDIDLEFSVIRANKQSSCFTDTMFLPKAAFSKLPKNTLAFWLPSEILHLFATESPLDPKLVDARCGMSSSDNTRFYKLWWEVDFNEVGENKTWSFLSNGGAPAPFIRMQTYVVNYKKQGKETKTRVADLYGTASRTIINEVYYRNPGFTYGKRTESITFQVLPERHVFSNEGQAIFPRGDTYKVNTLAYLNSSLIAYTLNSMAGQHKEAGYVGSMPCPPIAFLESQNVKNRTLSAIKMLHECYKAIPEYQFFCSPYIDKEKKFIGIDNVFENLQSLSKEFNKLLEQNDLELNELVGRKCGEFNEFSNRKWELANIVYNCDLEEVKPVIASDLLSYFVGCVFGRWDITKCFLNFKIEKFDQLFDKLPLQPPAYNSELSSLATSVLSAEPGNRSSITQEILNLVNTFFKYPEEIISDLQKTLNFDDLKDLFQGKCSFFDSHLVRYSKSRRQAPIYWPLQTPSGSYTLWLYYHRLNEQTLYTCVNDFVEPKLKAINDDLTALRSKTNRSSQEEKELERLTDFAAELKDYRDELLRIAKFWKPNLNDGVQITAAPLWKLFQHKAWQKKLKDTWQKLEHGEYDWAHLAYSIWPERVLRKCHQDRSLAIAHDVENDFWEEVEVPVKRGKKLTGATKLEWRPIDLSESELTALIQQKIAEAK